MDPKIFIEKVKQMRRYQKSWFAKKFRSDLEKAKRLEKEVDMMIAEGENPQTKLL